MVVAQYCEWTCYWTVNFKIVNKSLGWSTKKIKALYPGEKLIGNNRIKADYLYSLKLTMNWNLEYTKKSSKWTRKRQQSRDFPGGPVAKTKLPV